MDIRLIAAGLATIPAIYFCNNLIRRKNEVDSATQSINAALQDRYDLIPELIDTIKSYMYYECDALINLTRMHASALSYHIGEIEKIELNNNITSTLKQIMEAAEDYPELKFSDNFLQLQKRWTDIEDHFSASGRVYNNVVMDYNKAVISFPGNIFADLLGYKTKAIFEIRREFLNIKLQSLSYN
ncbi:LemA protein [Chitinophaga dinghuensis]|uniref:LemA protein n=1 Tax=Chitinophaga dinghuensis TaxID=1539050 RepID=A0A327VV70_9BACT|nr:LemA family protein [Chitinophaga dinghuensis]RAJ75111.1 LemA protein [Chitinophaga dinghuensis]